jgi:hypothetical protein
MASSNKIIFYTLLLLNVKTVIKYNQTVRFAFIKRN